MLIKIMLSACFIQHEVLQAKIVLENNVSLIFYTPDFKKEEGTFLCKMYLLW